VKRSIDDSVFLGAASGKKKNPEQGKETVFDGKIQVSSR
jgi:hypothetical protein